MRLILAVICGVLAHGAVADDSQRKEPETEVQECNACTARHKSLQRLQQSRTQSPKPEVGATEQVTPPEQPASDG